MAQAQRAITLGEANTGWLDLTVPANQKYYRSAMKELPGEKYDLGPEGLRNFLEAVKTRAIMYNWIYILFVPDLTVLATPRNFLYNYGTITMAECQAHAVDYMLARDRAAQDGQMLYGCLNDSLTKSAQDNLLGDAEMYTVEGYADGLCYLKLIISKAQVDTVATVNHLWTTISQFPTKIVELSGNITEFNNHVKWVENSLFSYGEPAYGVLQSIIMAYEEVEDEDFVQYIKMKKNLWEEGQIKLETKGFMVNVENYYKIRVQQGKWKSPTCREQQEIAAMKAIHSKGKDGKDSTTNTKLTYAEKMKKDRENNPEKYIAPKDGESHTKNIKGHNMHWCNKHLRWAGHTSAECEGVGVNMKHRRNGGGKKGNVAYNASNDDDSISKQSALTDTSVSTAPSVQVNRVMSSINKNGYNLFD